MADSNTDMDERQKLAAVAALGCVEAEDINEHVSIMLQTNEILDNPSFSITGPTDFDDTEIEYIYQELRQELEE